MVELIHINKPSGGRRLVIPDIHGCALTFTVLLKKIELTNNDQLFLLGDYIDRGKRTSQVLNKILELKSQEYQIFPLRGNHEEMVWQKHLKEPEPIEDDIILPRTKWGKDILNENDNILPQYVEFIKNLPYCYELDDFILTHAGIDFRSENPFEDYQSMIWMNEEIIPPEEFNKIIIHGHQISKIETIQKSIENREKVICLDNGCVYPGNKGYGNLLCLDLDSFELIIQPNVD